MKKKEDKKKDVDALHKVFETTNNVFITGFSQLKVDHDYQLRKAVRDAGGLYKVIKNTLAENAAKGTSSQDALSGLAGMTSMAYTKGDPIALAKALTAYAKDHPTFTFKAGVVEGRVVDAGAIVALASMPSREELFGKILFLIQAPATRMARAIGGAGRNLAVVIDQAVKDNKFSG
ncbi:MAG: 50S ribosomal protein L10 [Bryobacteraceae bacterium]|nr:50S ribosomal protein L10 [Bryobacteraceae bacterium]